MQHSNQAEELSSYITPIGYQVQSCGYCKKDDSGQKTPRSRCAYYIVARSLNPRHYEELLGRGWRRSGNLLYKPDIRHSCCPHYTIRLPVQSFKASKDQRQAVNRWNTYIKGNTYIEEAARLRPVSTDSKAKQHSEFNLCKGIAEGEYSRLKYPPKPEHEFEVTLEEDCFTEEKYQLFRNYQHHIHHEPISSISTRKGFGNFLCSSPLMKIRRLSDTEQQSGSYHQCYRLDGRLVAMAVLDLLPNGVSAVYFIHHVDFQRWSFGKLSALREIAMALETKRDYYYMGYYIHSCMKMRYKGDYKIQQILDPETLKWYPLDDETKRLLDLNPFISMSLESKTDVIKMDKGSVDNVGRMIFENPSEAAKAVSEGMSLFQIAMPGIMTVDDVVADINLDLIKIVYGSRRVCQAADFKSWNNGSVMNSRTLKGAISELAACVGPSVSREMIIQLSSS